MVQLLVPVAVMAAEGDMIQLRVLAPVAVAAGRPDNVVSPHRDAVSALLSASLYQHN